MTKTDSALVATIVLLISWKCVVSQQRVQKEKNAEVALQERVISGRGTTVTRASVYHAVSEVLIAKLQVYAELGKLDYSLIRRAESGEPFEAIVTFDESQILAEANRLRQQLRVDEDVGFIRQRKAELFRSKKTTAFAPLLSSGEIEILDDYRQAAVTYARFRDKYALLTLLKNPDVGFVAENRPGELKLDQSLVIIRAPETHAVGAVGANTAVAVLDTGVDYTRAEFGRCSAAGSNCKVVYAQDFTAKDDRFTDDDRRQHGTNVAAIVVGVAPQTKILALDVFEKQSDGNNRYWPNDVLRAIDFVISSKDQFKTVAINLSLGLSGEKYSSQCQSSAFTNHITNAIRAGIAVVAASGNDEFTDGLTEPACVPNVISVGAVYDSSSAGLLCADGDSFGRFVKTVDLFAGPTKVMWFSNSASFLTMLAPGGI